MMAAENHDSNIVEAAATSDSDTTKINDQPSNGDSNPPSVKGAASSVSPEEPSNKHIADIVDDLVNSAEPSISGGSDTESRLDALRKNGDKAHVRASSTARKPAVFKAVSVNKTFLAAKTTATATPKLGDSASPTLGTATLSSSSANSARPRLVAKSGGLVTKGTAATNGRPVAAPDASAVWNKNRPVPVPEPAKLTDEELKKYGIHVASRLQADDTKGEANWADIDDDDDDWAPEEIQWTDGTKSTIPHQEDHSHPSPQPPAVEAVVQAALASPVAQVSLATKDGNHVAQSKPPVPASDSLHPRPSGLPSGKGLILKGAMERPTLVVKPPAPPTPVKSPWASLPPIDKATPAAIESHGAPGRMLQHQYQPHQQYQPHPYRENYGPPHGPPHSATSPPPHFKEIAADDFSRGGFRDGGYQNRELFNSQSGRLEPVQDRRGGPRSDMHYRQAPGTMLLQRPSSMTDQPEPSAAFQTHRTSAQDVGPYGRRRGSSNVSDGSGSFMQRLGRPGDQHVPPELLARQPSIAGESDSQASPRNFSPSGPRSWQSRPSPSIGYAVPHVNGPPKMKSPAVAAATVTVAAPAIAVPPLMAAAPATASIEDELEMQKKIMRERRELAKKRRVEEEEREEAARRERIRLKLEAMGPAPERRSAKKEAAAKEDAAPPVVAPAAAGAASESKASGNRETTPESAPPTQPAADASSPASIAKRQPQPWQSPAAPSSERLSSWGSGSPAPTRNLWAAPSSNRNLGNGTTFVTEPYAPATAPIANKQGPGPIGPPTPQKNASTPAVAPIGPPKPTATPPAAPTATVPTPTAPAAEVARPTAAPASADSTRSAWTNAIKASDDNLLAQQKVRRAEQQREIEARGMTLNDLRPTIKDTWLPTRMSEEGDRIEEKSKRSVVHRPGNTTNGPAGPQAAVAPQQARPSRFFPARDVRLEAPTGPEAPTSGTGGGRRSHPDSPSPPPPDMDGHPVYDGDAAHPLVSLPRPQIVVRLPPKDRAGNASSESWHNQRGPGGQRGGQHGSQHPPSQLALSQQSPTMSGLWQAKIDTLLDRKATSPSKPTMGRSIADRSARSPVTESTPAQQRRPVAVMSPTSKRAPVSKAVPTAEEPITSRPMAEECFERQEMGSLPSVHLPHKAPELAWTPAAMPKPLARRYLPAPTTRVDHDTFLRDSFGAPYLMHIRMPGVPGGTKEVRLPMPRTHSNPRRSSHRSGRGPRGGNRGRETAASSVSGGASGTANDQSQPSSQGLPGGGNGNGSGNGNGNSNGGRSRGGGMRHRSENWTRNASAPVQT